MDKIFEQALLYDFYGELLTSHQRTVYEDVVFQDMSLGEIAQEQGISRQGVHDLIKRCDKILQDYESKLHLVERFSGAKEKISEILALTETSGDRRMEEGTAAKESESGMTVDETAEGGRETGADEQRMQRIRELALELIKEW